MGYERPSGPLVQVIFAGLSLWCSCLSGCPGWVVSGIQEKGMALAGDRWVPALCPVGSGGCFRNLTGGRSVLCVGQLLVGTVLERGHCSYLCKRCRRDEAYDRYLRLEDYYRRKDDSYYDRYKEHFDRAPLNSEGEHR